jgi:hypothetical protein
MTEGVVVNDGDLITFTTALLNCREGFMKYKKLSK